MSVAESWLKSEDPEHFAEAAIRCQHLGGFCISDGFCHHDGECFRTDRMAMVKACREIDRAADEQPQDVATLMRDAAALLRVQFKSVG